MDNNGKNLQGNPRFNTHKATKLSNKQFRNQTTQHTCCINNQPKSLGSEPTISRPQKEPKTNLLEIRLKMFDEVSHMLRFVIFVSLQQREGIKDNITGFVIFVSRQHREKASKTTYTPNLKATKPNYINSDNFIKASITPIINGVKMGKKNRLPASGSDSGAHPTHTSQTGDAKNQNQHKISTITDQKI